MPSTFGATSADTIVLRKPGSTGDASGLDLEVIPVARGPITIASTSDLLLGLGGLQG